MMSVPHDVRARWGLRVAGAMLLVAAAGAGWAKGPEPPVRLPLVPMGFQPPPSAPGAIPGAVTPTTVNFIDEQHLLVTFGVRKLMRRMPDCPKDDDDRIVEAVVVELPVGKVLARTQWRMHDAAPYLWSLGRGRFLVRVRDRLTTIAPLVNLARGEAFAEQPALNSNRRVDAVLLSPERDLLTVETTERSADPEARVVRVGGRGVRTQINFYRLLEPASAEGKMIVQAAGAASSEGLLALSLTPSGYIEVMQESPDRWLFDFDPYVGKYKELSPFDSTCRPRPVFVSNSEFVAFGCRGSNDKLEMGGFNMRGEQMWQQDFTDMYASPNFATAPAAGRFALSRNLVPTTAGITLDAGLMSYVAQEIRVYQTESGKQIFRAMASPVQRQGGNYDLSASGLQLAFVHDQMIEVDRLPGLSSADEKAVKVARADRPEDAMAAVLLASHAPPGKGAVLAVKAEPAAIDMPAEAAPAVPTTPAAAPVEEAQVPSPATKQVQNGDVEQQGPRKAPTLYTLPGEKSPEKPH